MPEELLIMEFVDAQEAAEFALEKWPDSIVYEEMLKTAPNDPWLIVVGLCDICGAKECFFIQAEAFEDGIIACECSECSNKSVYPIEEEIPNED